RQGRHEVAEAQSQDFVIVDKRDSDNRHGGYLMPPDVELGPVWFSIRKFRVSPDRGTTDLRAASRQSIPGSSNLGAPRCAGVFQEMAVQAPVSFVRDGTFLLKEHMSRQLGKPRSPAEVRRTAEAIFSARPHAP